MSLIQLNRIRSGFWIWGVVGENVVNRDLLYLSGDETWMHSNASAAGTMPARGVAMNTANAGETIGILLIGTIYGANWTWTPGAALYASTVAGQFTETVPVAPNVAQRVGEAYRTNLVFFDPDLTDENTAGAALIYARERPAASQGPRNVLNFIEGANVTLTVVDNVPNAEIDITIASAAGGADQDIFYPAPDPDDYKGTYASMLLADSQVVLIRQTFYLPSNYVATDGWSVDVIVIPDATGNLRWGVATNFAEVCNNEGYQTHTDSIALGQSAVTADEVECLDITAGLTGALAGDLVGIEFTRDSVDALDTINDEVHYIGVILRVPVE